MKIQINEELVYYCKSKIDQKTIAKKRFCEKDIVRFLQDDTPDKICGIYGLRRTGKTTMMLQAIRDIGIDDCAYIICNNNDSYIELEESIQALNKKYIFIDEITKVKDFINLSSSLSDIMSNKEKKIVITGTDSASLLFAKNDELFDRMDVIHTTYIPYAEYNYLFGKSLEEYIQYGGTLTNGKQLYNDDNLDEYTNTAILSNIYHSVENSHGNLPYRRLYDLLLSNSLEAAVNKTIEIRAREFSAKVVKGAFTKSHDFGSARDLILKNRGNINKDDIKTIETMNTDGICKFLTDKLSLHEVKDFNDTDITLITNLLKKLNVLTVLPDSDIIFTQPGMQYAFTETLIEGILASTEYKGLFPETQRIVLDKIMQDSIGHILENVIRVDVMKCSALAHMIVGKHDNIGDGEFDLYIINPQNQKAAVYEIKRTDVCYDKQCKHLINSDFCQKFEQINNCAIVDRAVIYQGVNVTQQVNNTLINYYNAGRFLADIPKYTAILKDAIAKDRGMMEEQCVDNYNKE